MSEVLFFMTEADTVAFCRFLVDSFSCDFAVDGVAEPGIQVLTVPEEVASARDPDGYHARLFVGSRLWSSYPLVQEETHHKDGRHRFYIQQRYGGPAFDYLVSRVRTTVEGTQIVPGWFSDYPWYYASREDRKTVTRPEAMQEAANGARRYLRRHGKRTVCDDSARPGPWVLSGALAAYHAGAWLRLGDAHYHPRTRS
jgi:hypothetical protein